EKEIAVEIYSYPDAASFLDELEKHDPFLNTSWYVKQSEETPYDVSSLQKAASVKGYIAQYQHLYWYSSYLVLPSSLPEGYYLVAAEIDGEKYYAQMQINTAAVYIMKTKDKAMAWLHNSVTGEPLAGAEFMVDGGKPVKSGRDGIAVLDGSFSADTGTYFLVKPAEGHTFIARVVNEYNPYYTSYYWDYQNMDIIDNYWTYLYLDRDTFLPEDTVNIWGVLKPRNSSSGEVEATLELTRYSYYSSEEEVSVLASQDVKISPSGTFTGTLEISNFNPDSYEVRVRVGNKVMMKRYLQIMDYTKPVYKIEAESSRDYMYAWDTVDFDMLASFYEGTPVSGVELEYTYMIPGADSVSGILTSDADGKSALSVKPAIREEGWRPVTLVLEIRNREAEEQQVWEYCHVTVFPRDTMIEVKSKIENQTAKLDFATSRIDLSKLESKPGGYYSEDDYRGVSADMPLSVKLYERYFEKKKTGEFYDFINKVRRDVYDYEMVSNLIGEYNITTVNGKYHMEFETEKDKNYFVEVTGFDSRGNRIKEVAHIYNWDYISPYESRAYTISTKDTYKRYKSGEPVSVEVIHNGERPAEAEKSKYLFVRLRNGIYDFVTSPESTYNFNFEDEFIPNIYVKAVCFDGAYLHDAGIRQYLYDSSEKELDISVKPGKYEYRPGETASLLLEVKDQNGKPCTSEINISVVDEAYFTLFPQYVDTLSSLYGPSVSSGVITDYFSYTAPDEASFNPMAEKGEGGDVYVRKDFKDSALFVSVTAGADGKASASFKLPDNLTSWRVTYQAVTEDLKAGSGKINISTKLPFFVDVIFNKSFITGDTPSILVRAYGAELDPGAQVDYNVTVTGPDGRSKSYKATGKANTIKEIAMDSLEAGNYTVLVEGTAGSLKDAIERSFRVSDSLLETSVTDYFSLSNDTVITNNTKGLTSLVFFGEDSAMLYRELRSLYWNWGERLDQKLAQKISAKLLQNYFDEPGYYDEEVDISRYQAEDGGLALLTYDSSNPQLSAKMCSLAADEIDREALAGYFKKLLNNPDITPEDAAYCYWGLAALKKPVLLDIRAILDTPGIAPEIRLILGVALAEIGDYQGAREIYTDIVRNSGKVTETYAWIEKETRDDSVEATALCSLIALRINAPEKIKLFNYIKSNSTSELLVNLERMVFVTNYIKEASLDSSFSYEINGDKKQVELKKGAYYRLDLTPDKLSALKFGNVRGKVAVAASYVAPIGEIRAAGDNLVSLERTYTIAGKSGPAASFNRSDTVKITLTPKFDETAPDGYYEITDILPAGFRFVRSDLTSGKDSNWRYPKEVTGQKVVFGYYYSKNNPYRKSSITYYAKAVSPGTYTADNAAIRHTDGKISGFAGKSRVTID
ncbi:MAG: alpha-2-macroglobulin family protein, partial [Bacillota bacterium]